MSRETFPATVLHWNYRGYTEFPLRKIEGDESEITDIYLKENLISRIPSDIACLERLESLYLSGNDITELPVEIASLRRLKCLDVSGNRLRSVPEAIGDVVSLKYLVLDDNQLVTLPLRLAELRTLRYLSVCDNNLQWLPQRPVHNYHHCELRFWRNRDLKTLPHAVWYHMLRDQQTMSLNIGCLKVPQFQETGNGRIRITCRNDSRRWDIDINCGPQYLTVLERSKHDPPSLFELSKRLFYDVLSKAARKISDERTERSIYCDNWRRLSDVNNNVTSLEENFSSFDIKDIEVARDKGYSVPADLIEEYFDFLPRFLKEEFSRGPVSRCENVKCKKPIFDFVNYEFCFGKIVLIDSTEDILLHATFCCQACANIWRGGKTNTMLTWKLAT